MCVRRGYNRAGIMRSLLMCFGMIWVSVGLGIVALYLLTLSWLIHVSALGWLVCLVVAVHVYAWGCIRSCVSFRLRLPFCGYLCIMQCVHALYYLVLLLFCGCFCVYFELCVQFASVLMLDPATGNIMFMMLLYDLQIHFTQV